MIKVTPKLIEQTRRWLTRTIWIFYHENMGLMSGESFEQWHEDKARDLLTFLNMPEPERAAATEALHVSSSNPERQKLCER